jgi:gliding motility-associated-like protein
MNESGAVMPAGQIKGDPECTCGLTGNSFYMDGNDTLVFPPEFSDLFTRDFFTFDFYFTVESSAGEMDVFSSGTACISNDSVMYMKYFGSTGEIFFLMGSNINNLLLARTTLDETICWHRFTLVKSKTEYFYYLDNKLILRFVSRENIPISRTNTLALGYNLCGVQGSSGFRGQFDEITWTDKAFSELEIVNSYSYPDQIINRDTTIFLGDVVTIQTGSTCAATIDWTPVTGLDLTSVFNPAASPEASVTYFSDIRYRHCTVRDSVRIYVVDKDELDCEKLLLPKAFTPNGDGLNDRYGISNLFIVQSLGFMEILDRSGAVIWRTEELGSTWDGTFKGNELSSGVYFYKVKYTCSGEEFLKIESFSLIR